MELVGFDDTYQFEETGDGLFRTQVLVSYKTILATVRELDAMTLPEGVDLRRRVSNLRGWALTTVPEGDPTRDAILESARQALREFRIKRVIVPAGTSVDGVLELELGIDGAGWSIRQLRNTAYVSGEPDQQPELPFENSPEMQARFAELELLADEMKRMRDEFLQRREKTAAESRAALTKSLVTGRTFEGIARRPDGSNVSVRIVITRGLEMGEVVIGTVATDTESQRSAQFTGKLRQQPDGEFFWEGARSLALSGEDGFPNLQAGRPTLRMAWDGNGLRGAISNGSDVAFQVTVNQGEIVDVIPEVPPNPEQ